MLACLRVINRLSGGAILATLPPCSRHDLPEHVGHPIPVFLQSLYYAQKTGLSAAPPAALDVSAGLFFACSFLMAR